MEDITLAEIERLLLVEIADSLSIDSAKLRTDTPLTTVGIDSVSLLQLFAFVENTFNVNLMNAGFTRADLQDISSLAKRIRMADRT